MGESDYTPLKFDDVVGEGLTKISERINPMRRYKGFNNKELNNFFKTN